MGKESLWIMKKILLVDDNKDFLNHLSYFFKNKKVDVTLSYSADEALNNIRQKDFDLICSDYNMGDTNGLDLLKELRKNNNDVKFIMLTGDDSSELQYQVEKLNGIFLDKGNMRVIDILNDSLMN